MGNEANAFIAKKGVRSPLIIDPDGEFLASFWADKQVEAVPPLLAQTGKEAQQILADFKEPFSGVFINPEIEDISAISVVKACHLKHAGVPIFFISDRNQADLNFTQEVLNGLGIQKILSRKVTYTELLKLVTPTALLFEPQKAIEVAKLNTDELGTEVNAVDTLFTPVRAENFLSGTLVYFDLYIQITRGKYVKIIRAGDQFSPDRVQTYMKKGVTHIFLRKEALEHYLNYCDKLVSAIVKKDSIPTSVKLVQTFHQGEETLEYLKNVGISRVSLDYASSFINNVRVVFDRIPLERHQSIAAFMNDFASYKHGVGTAIIASLLCRQLGISHDRSIQVVGMGSLLHDIGLVSQAKLQTESEENMSDEELATYHTHPIAGGSLLKSCTEIDALVPQIVEQHHERIDRSGFPHKLGRGGILHLAEIVGIADMYFHLVQETKNDSSINPSQRVMENMNNLFSKNIAQAFKNIFAPDAPRKKG